MKILELGGAGEKETAVGAEEECVLIGLCFLFVCFVCFKLFYALPVMHYCIYLTTCLESNICSEDHLQ